MADEWCDISGFLYTLFYDDIIHTLFACIANTGLYCIHSSAVLLTLDYIVEVFTLLAEVRSELQ